MTDKMAEVPDFLRLMIELNLDVNAVDVDNLIEFVNDPDQEDDVLRFKQEFAEAFRKGALTQDVYRELTGGGFDSQEALDAWLEELWETLFPDEPL